jgi:hypothetical protein
MYKGVELMLFFEEGLKNKNWIIKNIITKSLYESLELNYPDVANKAIIYIKNGEAIPSLYYEPKKTVIIDEEKPINMSEYSDRIIIGLPNGLTTNMHYDAIASFFATIVKDYSKEYSDRYKDIDDNTCVEIVIETLKGECETFSFVNFEDENIEIEEV